MFAKLKIAQRLYAGFGLVVVILAAVALFNLLGIIAGGDKFTDLDEMSEDYRIVSELGRDVLDVEKDVLDWLRSENEEKISEITEEFEVLRGEIADARQFIMNPRRVPLVQEIDERMDRFFTAFPQVVSLTEERGELFARLTERGALLVDDLKEIQNTAFRDNDFEASALTAILLEEILLGRTFVARYLDTQDRAEADVAR
ncbi:MAG: hypothetical protein AAF684_03915, partial [Pseudomonadota bacterium]